MPSGVKHLFSVFGDNIFCFFITTFHVQDADQYDFLISKFCDFHFSVKLSFGLCQQNIQYYGMLFEIFVKFVIMMAQYTCFSMR